MIGNGSNGAEKENQLMNMEKNVRSRRFKLDKKKLKLTKPRTQQIEYFKRWSRALIRLFGRGVTKRCS